LTEADFTDGCDFNDDYHEYTFVLISILPRAALFIHVTARSVHTRATHPLPSPNRCYIQSRSTFLPAHRRHDTQQHTPSMRVPP
jgi:hypothetical protein